MFFQPNTLDNIKDFRGQTVFFFHSETYSYFWSGFQVMRTILDKKRDPKGKKLSFGLSTPDDSRNLWNKYFAFSNFWWFEQYQAASLHTHAYKRDFRGKKWILGFCHDSNNGIIITSKSVFFVYNFFGLTISLLRGDDKYWFSILNKYPLAGLQILKK